VSARPRIGFCARLWRRRHCRSHPPRIRQSLSNSAAVPWSLRPAGVMVIRGSLSAAPSPHRSRSIVRSVIDEILLVSIWPQPILWAIKLLSRKTEYRGPAGRAVVAPPAAIINDMATSPTPPLDDSSTSEFRFPLRELGLLLGSTRERCACRGHFSRHVDLLVFIYLY